MFTNKYQDQYSHWFDKGMSKDIVARLLAGTENTKHKLLVSLCWGMGLRVNEVYVLKIFDVVNIRMQFNIVKAKSKKTGILP